MLKWNCWIQLIFKAKLLDVEFWNKIKEEAAISNSSENYINGKLRRKSVEWNQMKQKYSQIQSKTSISAYIFRDLGNEHQDKPNS